MHVKKNDLKTNLKNVFASSRAINGKITDLGRKVGIRHRLERCRVYAEEYIAHYYIHFCDNNNTRHFFVLSEKLFDQLHCGQEGTLIVKSEKAIAFIPQRLQKV